MSPSLKTTVKLDIKERVAEERPAWKHKNVPAWTKNVMFSWDFGRLPSVMYVVKERGKNAAWR